MKKKIICLLLCLLLLLPCTVWAEGSGISEAEQILQQAVADDSTMIILQTGDINGKMDEKGDVIGMPKLAGLLEAQSKVYASLLLDSGNALGSDPDKMIKLMGAVGYSAAAIGTKDASLGVPALQTLASKSSFPLLCANWLRKDGELYFDPYTIVDVGMYRIGIIGLISPEIAQDYPDLTENDNVYDPGALANIYYDEMSQQGCTLYIALASLGLDGEYTARKLASDAPWLSLIFDSNTDTVLELGEVVEKTNVILFNQAPGFTSVNQIEAVLNNGQGNSVLYPSVFTLADLEGVKPSELVKEVLKTDYSVKTKDDGNGIVSTEDTGNPSTFPRLILGLSLLAAVAVIAGVIAVLTRKRKK